MEKQGSLLLSQMQALAFTKEENATKSKQIVRIPACCPLLFDSLFTHHYTEIYTYHFQNEGTGEDVCTSSIHPATRLVA